MNTSENRRKVLFVDDDADFLGTISSLMARLSQETWEIQSADSAGRALALLQQQPVDLVVIDVKMPLLDGPQLIQLIHRKYPNIQKAVLTAHATDAHRAACLSNGAELFLEKPLTTEGFNDLFTMLNELARLQPEEGFRGVLRRVGLTEVLQMECLARNSSVLEISAGGVTGEIFIKSGEIIHARTGGRRGVDAFNFLLTLSGGQFNLRNYVAPPERSIDGSWEFLIMEASRQRDEALASPVPASVPDLQPVPVVTGTEKKPVMEAPSMTSYLPRHEEPPVPGPRQTMKTNIDEVLVCSAQGEVLYEWQCPNTDARISFLEFLSQKSRQLGLGLPLGHFDRIEIQTPQARIVTQIQPERALFVRSSKIPEKPAAA